ncbi:hypothetical protein GP486_000908 [Trichoglossum hirsutum]|uniref:SAC domain-containing protein n=1 Tax=Trichoglossum hirsutum TaxID=265104 RepID=A0A9P8LI51_9PEZI|nr:hypothetical protein GP486_000908 [Trichoglossum hirsutum]
MDQAASSKPTHEPLKPSVSISNAAATAQSVTGRQRGRGVSDTPGYPQLSNNPPASARALSQSTLVGENEEPAVAKSSGRTSRPKPTRKQRRDPLVSGGIDQERVCRMHKYSFYETATRYYVVGGDLTDSRFRILKIDRTSEFGDLSVTEDEMVYTKEEMNRLLSTIDDGNKSTGGLKLKCSTSGLLGFIRFTGPYYMLLITKRSQVAMIGGHYIYQIDGTELVPLTATSSRLKPDRNTEEARFLAILNNLDLSRSFYFSYSYEITRTLQHNITREREALKLGQPRPSKHDSNAMFVWNHYLLQPVMDRLKNVYDWFLPIVHGYVDQARQHWRDTETTYRTYVSLYVETSAIITNRLEVNLVDPFYSAAALHFDNLFERYGAPIYVLNLVKARERTPRESKLLKEYTNAISYLNQFLPREKRIIYKAWDMSRASKRLVSPPRDQDVIATLEAIAEDVVSATGFFHNGDGQTGPVTVQNGVARTNCIDCLDRTNAAQFVIGKRALGYQLHALGVISEKSVEYDTDAVNLFTHMYHDHGDTIAVQYGGSHLVNTMETYRKINQWTSHSRDMVESFKRYYNNSFLDGQRQEAYNLFLGNYIFAQGQPMLWDLATDYYLHHADPRGWLEKHRRSYTNWYTPEFLELREMPPVLDPPSSLQKLPCSFFDDYWLEYYRPLAVSSFLKIFSFKLNSTIRYIPLKLTQEGKYDLSPFRVRTGNDQEAPEKKKTKKGVTIVDPQDELSDDASSQISQATTTTKRTPIQRWLQPQTNDKSLGHPSIIKDTQGNEMGQPTPPAAADKLLPAQWTLDEFVGNSLNPSVTRSEAEEYERYITHPLKLPLVVSTETPPNPSLDILEYVNSTSPEAVATLHSTEEDIADYEAFLRVSENPLTVSESDTPMKRYNAYSKWLRGKSIFKQRVDT